MMLPGEIPTTILYSLGDGACRTMDELDEALDLSRHQISKGATKLIFRGLAERVEAGCYRLTDAGKQAVRNGVQLTSGPIKPDRGKRRKPQRNTLRQRAWNIMRMGDAFTVPDLMMVVQTGGEKTAANNLHRYIRALTKHGYLLEMPRRMAGTKVTSNGYKRWKLLNDTGPIAPVLRPGSNVMFDHNLGEVVPCR
ncbi:helix-turn-helix domain-containing protein [Pseudovibrio sp. SPO723]|uniref:helix-turn-helix domain-containing protein n=1 Tax=Nesiotobacter zosterae TaxID=392721 RepID=UPI0029C5C6FB|nr:helix-turn-helix domain-containing protein [Pseudovibrio sp. SPO723]MDX5595296.1 helix-turn-helix domain-containing protein [Pseudovibrio sp. SPO723]